MMMPIGNSLTFYEQGPEGRVSRASDNKTNCGLVLLEPDNSMVLKVQIEEKLSIERGEKGLFSQIVDEVHDCYPYYNDTNGKLIRVNREDYGKMLEELLLLKQKKLISQIMITRTQKQKAANEQNNLNLISVTMIKRKKITFII